MALRFANALFEPLWHRGVIDHVQVTVAEKIGVEGRADYYDQAGAMRDMVQNHLLQLLCLVAMEPPNALAADAVCDAQVDRQGVESGKSGSVRVDLGGSRLLRKKKRLKRK